MPNVHLYDDGLTITLDSDRESLAELLMQATEAMDRRRGTGNWAMEFDRTDATDVV